MNTAAHTPSAEVSRLKAWLTATRPHTLAASACPVVVASSLAWRMGTFRPVPALLCLLVAVLAQVAANLSNDYFDYKKGADTERRVGQRRAVASGWIAPRTMLTASLITLGLACLCGLGLLAYGDWRILLPAGIAIALCVPAYTAGPYPLAYHGWGDACVLLFYGVVPVCLTYYVQAGAISSAAVWLSIALGLLSINILLVNNVRDREQDAAAGKRTTVVRFGRRFGTWLYLVCALLAVVCSWPVYLYRSAYTWLLFLIFLAFELITWHDLRRLRGSDLNRVLNLTARNIWIYTLLLISLLVF